MKQIGLIVALVVAPMALWAQSNAVTDFQEKYKNDRDASYVEISGNLFKFLGSIKDADNDDIDPDLEALSRIAEGLESMQILSIDKYKTDVAEGDIDALKGALKREKYESLMSIKEGRQTVNFMAQGQENELRNMLIVIDQKEEFVLISIDGILSSSDLSYISKKYNHWD